MPGIQISYTEKSATVIFDHLDLNRGNQFSPPVELVLEKKTVHLREGESYHHRTLLIDQETDKMKSIAWEAEKLLNLPEVERLSPLLKLLRGNVGYAYDETVEFLSKANPELASWITTNTGLVSRSMDVPLSQLIEKGYGICRHLSVAYLWLAQKAGLQGVILWCPAGVVKNIMRTDIKENLFKSIGLGELGDAHSWVEIRLNNGKWIPIDPSTQLIGGTQEGLKMFREANYRASVNPGMGYEVKPQEFMVYMEHITPFTPSQITTCGTVRLKLSGTTPTHVIGLGRSGVIPSRNVSYSGSGTLIISTGIGEINGLGLDIKKVSVPMEVKS